MKNIILLALVGFVILSACKQSKTDSANAATDKGDTTKFFQVAQFIQSEINEVNKTPYYLYKLDLVGNKKDSTVITPAEFNQLAKQFTNPDINDPALKKSYKENIFHDQTTKSFAISYTATDKELEIQNIEVLLEEDGSTVKRLFIRKFKNNTDSSVIEQLSWKPGHRFQINHLSQKPDKSEVSHQTIVVWKEDEENS